MPACLFPAQNSALSLRLSACIYPRLYVAGTCEIEGITRGEELLVKAVVERRNAHDQIVTRECAELVPMSLLELRGGVESPRVLPRLPQLPRAGIIEREHALDCGSVFDERKRCGNSRRSASVS